MDSFNSQLKEVARHKRSWLCVGLDMNPEALGENDPGHYMEMLGYLEQTGTKLGETWFVGNLSRLLEACGQTGPARAAMEQCLAIAEGRGERFYLDQLPSLTG